MTSNVRKPRLNAVKQRRKPGVFLNVCIRSPPKTAIDQPLRGGVKPIVRLCRHDLSRPPFSGNAIEVAATKSQNQDCISPIPTIIKIVTTR